MNIKIKGGKIHSIIYKVKDTCSYTLCGIPLGNAKNRIIDSPLTCKTCIKLELRNESGKEKYGRD